MASDYYGQYMGTFRNILITTLEPLDRVAILPTQIHRWYLNSSTEQDLLHKELITLRTENLVLKSQNQRIIHLEQEIARLQKLLGTTGITGKHNIQIASVIKYSSNPLSQQLTINKGLLDKVQPSQAVIDAYGVLGQVIHTTPLSSQILLITDLNHQIPIRVQRTGQRGIIAGRGGNELSLEYIPNNSSIEVGDVLVTSGLGGVFPPGYPVATVESLTQEEGKSYLLIKAKPLAHIQQSYEVLLLADNEEDRSDDRIENKAEDNEQ